VYIISHYGGKGEKVFPSFDYEDGDLSEKAFNAMVRFTPDVVHIQHEFGLFGKNFGVNVIPLIINFNLVGIPVVTTLHTVYREIPESHKIILRNICLNSDKIIVHETYQKGILKNHFDFINDDKIHVIPHGARELDPIPHARKKLGLPSGKPILLMIGYFRPSKNFERIIDILPEIINHVPDALLVIAGKIRGKEHLDYRRCILYHLYGIRSEWAQGRHRCHDRF
jgi:glycosyltransferase involved in cell wall biosynthesis